MLTRSFGNGFEVQDWTEEVNVVPNQWGTIGRLGLFKPEPVAEHSVVFEEITRSGGLIVDRVRGERTTANKDAQRNLHTFAIPHFPFDDIISPHDLQGKRAYGSSSEAETLARKRVEKMERIRQVHAMTLEYARALAITTGDVYAPNNTVVKNWFTEFGVTRTTVDFTFGTTSANMNEKTEVGVSSILTNANGESMTGVVMLCSPEFFAAYIKHPSVVAAYANYASSQEPNRQRLGGFAMNRMFNHAGVTMIEMHDNFNGNRLIPAGKAYMVPTGTQETFRTYFSPAERFGLVNTLGEEVYLFESMDSKGTKYELESESNFVNALLRPALSVECTSSN